MSFRAMVHRRRIVLLVLFVVFAAAGAGALGLRGEAAETPASLVDWRAQLSPLSPTLDGNRLVQPLSDGGRVELTLDPGLQGAAEQLLRATDAPRAAAVVLDVSDGRVLALAGRTRTAPAQNDVSLPLSVWAPAASVFKLVTTAALLDAGVRPDARVCYHGGVHSLEADNLAPARRRDDRCGTLTYGLAKSQNAIVGRLAHEHLDQAHLGEIAAALGFGAAPSLELPVQPSTLTLPSEPLAFARTAAGFWQSALSPLHGALLAATIARGGRTLPAHLVARVVDGRGRELPVAAPADEARAIGRETAETLGRMMINTTEWGSAQRSFHDARHRRLLGVRVAGKTGTLTGAQPDQAYSWFVGFAPAEQPRIAFAVLLARADESDLRAADVARAVVAAWLDRGAAGGLVAAR
jgi:cell division protein FtsI/penicillin-binding protein 2